MAIQNPPAGCRSLTPYLAVDGAAKAIDFYRDVFGATELMRLPMPGGRLAHAEIRIGDSLLMLADEFPDMGFHGPGAGGSPVNLMLYVDDVDAVFARALAAGARQLKPVQDQFYGDRSGSLADPFGHVWLLATHVEDVTPEEIQRRMAQMAGQAGG